MSMTYRLLSCLSQRPECLLCLQSSYFQSGGIASSRAKLSANPFQVEARLGCRKLRIAWSVGCAIACVLLIVLWVRSYWRKDIVHLPTQQDVIVNSAYGVLRVNA